MMKFFVFELKRFIRSPKNKICLGLLFSIIVGLFIVYETIYHQQSVTMSLDIAKLNLQQAQLAVSDLEKVVEETPDDEASALLLANAEIEYELLSEQVTALENEDFQTYADLEYQLNEIRLETLSDEDSEEYQSLVAANRYMDAVKAAGGTPSESINQTSESAFTTGSYMLAWLSSASLFVLFTVLVADSVSHEIESSQIRFYNLVGGRTTKTFALKLLVPILTVLGTTVVSFLVIYLLKGLLGTFGIWQYPYMTTGRMIIPIWQAVLHTLILFICALLFLASLGQLLSLIFKKSLVVIGLIVLCLIAFMTFSREAWFQPIKPFLPFEYLGYGRLLNDVAILPNHSFLIGILYLCACNLIFFTISAILYKGYYQRKAGQV